MSIAAGAQAGEVDVIGGSVRCAGDTCTVSATLRHADTGWDHYADSWRILAPDGTELGRRELLHPHVDEQPFTRSLDGVIIPVDVREVILEGHDSVHEAGGRTLRVAVEGR